MMRNTVLQAYRQAPWRLQLQWMGIFLLVLVLVAAVASIYLSVTTSAAAAGRDIQKYEYNMETMRQNIANLRTELAQQTSSEVIKQRARDMGFEPAAPTSTLYLSVPDYPGKPLVSMAQPPEKHTVSQTLLRPSYTQSLWDWLYSGFVQNMETAQLAQPVAEGNLP